MVRRLQYLVIVVIFLVIAGVLYINLSIAARKDQALKYRKKHFKDKLFHREVAPNPPERDRKKAWLDNLDEAPLSWRRKQKKKKRKPRLFRAMHDELDDRGRKKKRRRLHRPGVLEFHKKRKKHRPGSHSRKRKIPHKRKRFHKRPRHSKTLDSHTKRKTHHRKRKHHKKKVTLDVLKGNMKSDKDYKNVPIDDHLKMIPDSSNQDLKLQPKHPRWQGGGAAESQINRHAFMRKMGKPEILLTMQTIKRFEELMRQHGIVFFMSVKTLLGSYRHHGFIPWDENIDFVLPRKNQEQLVTILKSLEPEYSLYREKGSVWKLSFWQAKSFDAAWKWPYVGLGFFDTNATHIWNIEPYGKMNHVYQMIDVFPLKTRPFMGMALPSPNQDRRVLTKSLDMSSCTSPSYDYKHGLPLDSIKMDCSSLKSKYPFVERNELPSGLVNETLIYKENIVGWFVTR